MRTTLTIEDDVAALLDRAKKARKLSLKQIVNQALRKGLKDLMSPAQRQDPYRTPTGSLGRCLVGSIDDVAEVLDVAEGEKRL